MRGRLLSMCGFVPGAGMGFDLVVQGGTVVTGSDMFVADIGIEDGVVTALGRGLEGARRFNAEGRLVLPGGVDTHCHIEQLRPEGGADEETFVTGSRAALAGGTTSVVTFATQFRGQGLMDTLAEYRRRARSAMVDYGLHQIITDATDAVVLEDIPRVVAQGVRSLKVFLTYDPLHLDDRAYLRVLAAARRAGALVTVHCENYEAIRWRSAALMADGRTAPKYHAWSRPAVVEREATHRAIALAELVDQPVQIFHVSCGEVMEEVERAQRRGVKVWAETCPQYLVLRDTDMDRPGFEGAKYMCSPSPRGQEAADDLWGCIRRGSIDVVSSDHSGWSYDGPHGKRLHGEDAPFPLIPNGVPGLAARLPVLFSEGVAAGRIDAPHFVRLVATNPARLFGLYPQKGTIAIGSDADLVVWDADRRVTLTQDLMQQAIDYTPFEGMQVTGWPVAVFRRGALVMEHDRVLAEPGSGRYLAREPYPYIAPCGVLPYGFDASRFHV